MSATGSGTSLLRSHDEIGNRKPPPSSPRQTSHDKMRKQPESRSAAMRFITRPSLSSVHMESFSSPPNARALTGVAKGLIYAPEAERATRSSRISCWEGKVGSRASMAGVTIRRTAVLLSSSVAKIVESAMAGKRRTGGAALDATLVVMSENRRKSQPSISGVEGSLPIDMARTRSRAATLMRRTPNHGISSMIRLTERTELGL